MDRRGAPAALRSDSAMASIGARLEAHGGVGPGFDAVRLGLAMSVLFIHTSLIAPGVVGREDAPLFPFAPVDRWAFNAAIVPMFFALSGFLVAASAERHSVGRFLASRVLRIFPALAAAVLFAALVLGPALTTLPLADYFGDRRFWTYLLNLAGLFRSELPEVFASNPQPGVVNGALWTIPHELACYVMLAGLVAAGVFRNRVALLALTLGLMALACAIFVVERLTGPTPLEEHLSYIFVTRGAARLVPMFLLGAVLYRWRDRVPYSPAGAMLAILGYAALCSLGEPGWSANPLFNAAAAPLLAYAVISAGLSPAFEMKALKGRDYSFGVYLYGFPLQQALLALWPDMTDVATFFALSVALSLAMAALSWRFVEKPALALRKRFPVIAGSRQARSGAPIGRARDAAFT